MMKKYRNTVFLDELNNPFKSKVTADEY